MTNVSIWHWIIILLFFLFALPFALLPTIIAIYKNHPYKIAIIIINIFGGFLFGFGWIISLIWCFVIPKNETAISLGVADEIDRLHQLKERGVLTQEEFDTQKKAMLG